LPELRQNLITREWVIIATERAKRPEEFKKEKREEFKIPEYEPNCPFCPGNEDKTPEETFSIRDEKGWKVRVVLNKYAALSKYGEKIRKIEGVKRCMNGVGIHEVVIETPIHNKIMALLSLEEVKDIIKTYKNRYIEISQDKRIEMIIIFKNHGESAGTSLLHPHSQIIATPVVPLEIRHRMEIAMNYFDDTGECIFCKILNEELSDGERIVFESKNFLSFVPYAAFSPFHIWIFPKRHISSFRYISEEEIEDLSYNLRVVLRKLYFGVNNPDFNYCIRSVPTDDPDVDYFHWYLTIVPRVTKTAGFELGSGMFINTALPEESAKFLRGIKVE
jgi:UDPglucose--hexose-1-phosphate uridylyltransferase